MSVRQDKHVGLMEFAIAVVFIAFLETRLETVKRIVFALHAHEFLLTFEFKPSGRNLFQREHP